MRRNDYVLMAVQSNIDIERFYVESMLQIFEIENDFITECMESGMITIEAAEIHEEEKKVKRSFIDRIFDALHALFGTFKKKTLSIVDRDKDFFQNDLADITEEDKQNCPDFKCCPYWDNNSTQIIFSNLKKITDPLMNACKNDKNMKTMEDMEKVVRGVVGGENQNIARDVERFLNTGDKSKSFEEVTCTSKDLEEHWLEICDYCSRYDKIIMTNMRKNIRNLERDANNLERALNAKSESPASMSSSDNKNEAQKESFCYLENTTYNNTLIGGLYDPFVDYVLEADNNTNSSSNTSNNNSNDKSKSDAKLSTSVTAVTPEDNKTDDEKKKDQEQKDNDIEMLKNLIAMIKILEGAVCNVLEAKYTTFMNILRFVHSNRKKTDGKETSENKESKEESKENKENTRDIFNQKVEKTAKNYQKQYDEDITNSKKKKKK